MIDMDLTPAEPPPIPEGHERTWYMCRTCCQVSYYDYEPYIGHGFTWLPCGHGGKPHEAGTELGPEEGPARARDQSRLRMAQRGVEAGHWILLQPKQVAKLLDLDNNAEVFRILAGEGLSGEEAEEGKAEGEGRTAAVSGAEAAVDAGD